MAVLHDSILVLNTIRAVVGELGMQSLYAEKNASEIFIPLRVDDDHWMTKLFGLKQATEICDRLSVTNADGRKVGNLRAYVTNGKSRVQVFLDQIRKEVTEQLLSGKGVKDIARDARVAERTVRKEYKSLCDVGLLERPKRGGLLPAPKVSRAALSKLPVDPGHWEIKAALVDEALLSSLPTGRISVAVGVSRGYVRIRRKMLEAAGKLHAAQRRSAPDHSANVGEMVATPSEEVL